MAENSEKVKLMGLWTNTSKSGMKYMSGTLGACRVLIFPNGYRRNENDPSHIVYLAPREKKEDAGAPPVKASPRADENGRPYDNGAPPPDDTDIPF